MPEKEMIKVSVEEFSRLQNYMLASEKDSFPVPCILPQHWEECGCGVEGSVRENLTGQ